MLENELGGLFTLPETGTVVEPVVAADHGEEIWGLQQSLLSELCLVFQLESSDLQNRHADHSRIFNLNFPLACDYYRTNAAQTPQL